MYNRKIVHLLFFLSIFTLKHLLFLCPRREEILLTMGQLDLFAAKE